MADTVYLLYGLTAAEVTTAANGDVVTGKPGRVYTTPVGGTPFTDIRAVNFQDILTPGAELNGQFSSNNDGRIGFYAPQGTGTLWIDWQDGKARWVINPAVGDSGAAFAYTDTKFGQVSDSITATVATAKAQAISTSAGDASTKAANAIATAAADASAKAANAVATAAADASSKVANRLRFDTTQALTQAQKDQVWANLGSSPSSDTSNAPWGRIDAANGGTGAYPPRPATTRSVTFRGAVAPGNDGSVNGGGGMVPVLDDYIIWTAQ